MKKTWMLLLATALACAVARADVPKSGEQAKIAKLLDGIRDAAEKKDVGRLEGFHAYNAKFTKFDDDALARQDAVAGKKGERDIFTGARSVALQLDDVKIDIFGTTAIATMILRYSLDTGSEKVAGTDRATLVFAKDGGTWKIVHEHMSPFKPHS